MLKNLLLKLFSTKYIYIFRNKRQLKKWEITALNQV